MGFVVTKDTLLSLIVTPDLGKSNTTSNVVHGSVDLNIEKYVNLLHVNKALLKEVEELKKFYQGGDVYSLKKTYEIPIQNSFSPLVESTTLNKIETTLLQSNFENNKTEVCSSNVGLKRKSKLTKNKSLEMTVGNKVHNDKIPTRHNITLMADSQGRDVTPFLDTLLSGKCNVYGLVQPGALLETVLKSVEKNTDIKLYGENDWVILMAGCNNIANINDTNLTSLCNEMKTNFEKQINNLNKTNVIIATIPYRYDLHNYDRRQTFVSEINNEIRNLTHKYSTNVHLLDLFLLERHYHTKQGYHINKKGKRHVSRLICDIMFGKPDPQNDVTTCGITVTNQVMAEMVKKHRNDCCPLYLRRLWP